MYAGKEIPCVDVCVCGGGVQQETSFLFLYGGFQDFNSEALTSLTYFSFVAILGLTTQPRLAWVSQSSCLNFLRSGITGMSQHPHFPLLKKNNWRHLEFFMLPSVLAIVHRQTAGATSSIFCVCSLPERLGWQRSLDCSKDRGCWKPSRFWLVMPTSHSASSCICVDLNIKSYLKADALGGVPCLH